MAYVLTGRSLDRSGPGERDCKRPYLSIPASNVRKRSALLLGKDTPANRPLIEVLFQTLIKPRRHKISVTSWPQPLALIGHKAQDRRRTKPDFSALAGQQRTPH